MRVAVGDTVNFELRVAVPGRGGVPAALVHLALAHKCSVAGVDELVGVALEDDDVLRRYANLPEIANDFEEHLGVRDRAGDVSALPFFPDGVDLDADDVVLLEEALPCLERMIGAGERTHPLVHHLADRCAIDDVAVIHCTGMLPLDY